MAKGRSVNQVRTAMSVTNLWLKILTKNLRCGLSVKMSAAWYHRYQVELSVDSLILWMVVLIGRLWYCSCIYRFNQYQLMAFTGGLKAKGCDLLLKLCWKGYVLYCRLKMKIRIATYNVHGWVDEHFDSNLDRVCIDIYLVNCNVKLWLKCYYKHFCQCSVIL